MPIVTLITLCATTVEAQRPTTTKKDSIRVYSMQQIEVTATRAKQTTPVAHTNLNQEQIARQNFGQDVPYLLQSTPSIVVTSDAGNGIGYTDIRLRGTNSQRINVTTNGVAMNDAESHKLYWVDTPDLMSSVGSIQIQRGAGTSTNGAGAFGGSINMTTSAIPTEFGGEAALSYGSYNTNKQSVGISTGLLGGKWALDARLSHIGSDGYIDRAATNLSSYMVQGGYYAKSTSVKLLSFGGKERTYNAWDGLTREQLATQRRYNPCGEITDDSGRIVGFYADQVDNYLQINNQLVISHQFDTHWTANVTGHYTYGEGYYEQYKNNRKLKEYGLPNITTEAGTVIKKSNLVRKKEMSNNFGGAVASVNYTSERFNATIGGAWNLYSGDHWGSVIAVLKDDKFATPNEYYRNDTRKTDANIFVKAEVTLFKGFTLFGDVQYRRIRHKINGTDAAYDYAKNDWEGGMLDIATDRTFGFWNPKAGVSYTFASHHRLYASFAIAQKEPTRDDFTNAVKEHEPKSEKMYDWEAGYEYTGKWLAAGVNLYYMNYHDQLVMNGKLNLNTYDPIYENVAHSYRCGVELSATAKATKWLSVGGNLTFSRNKIKDYVNSVYTVIETDTDYKESNEEKYIGTTDISYSPSTILGVFADFHTSGFSAIVNTRYISKQYFTNTATNAQSLPSYCTTDLNLGYEFSTRKAKSIRFAIAVNNIFNKRYCSYAYVYDGGVKNGVAYSDDRFFPQATTNVLANVTVKF